MNNLKKKGFTIVELVIVVAVIAILAAVLIPTFSNLVKKANMSADEVAVRNMNTALEMFEVEDGKIDTPTEARAVLLEAGYNSENLVPTSNKHSFYWSSTYNVVLLVDCNNADDSQWVVVFPTKGYDEAIAEFNDKTNRGETVFNLAALPYAEVIRTDNNELTINDILTEGKGPLPGTDLTSLTLDTSLKFVAKDTPEEAKKQEYGEWIVDFVITSNQDLDKYVDQNISFYLAGQYDFFDPKWVVINIDDLGVKADQAYNLLEPFDIEFDYVSVCELVKSFQCGIAAVGGVPKDLSITVQLVMYTSSYNYHNQIIDYIIYEYTYTYE